MLPASLYSMFQSNLYTYACLPYSHYLHTHATATIFHKQYHYCTWTYRLSLSLKARHHQSHLEDTYTYSSLPPLATEAVQLAHLHNVVGNKHPWNIHFIHVHFLLRNIDSLSPPVFSNHLRSVSHNCIRAIAVGHPDAHAEL